MVPKLIVKIYGLNMQAINVRYVLGVLSLPPLAGRGAPDVSPVLRPLAVSHCKKWDS